MSQVSLPMRIALAATLVLAAIWFVALRPKPPVSTAAATPDAPATSAPQSGPGRAAASARQAVGTSQQSAAAHEGAANAVGADPATSEGSSSAAATSTRSAGAKAPVIDLKAKDKLGSAAATRVLRDVVDGKVAVLLFWDRRLSDDRDVHRVVTHLDKRHGKVGIHVASIDDLADYEAITRGVPVVTSPTTLVIDRAGRARSVGGLTVAGELDELIGKALKVKP